MDTIQYFIIDHNSEMHNDIKCPKCDSYSRPYGLGVEDNNKIQLVRQCRSCNYLYWYWIERKESLIHFGDD